MVQSFEVEEFEMQWVEKEMFVESFEIVVDYLMISPATEKERMAPSLLVERSLRIVGTVRMVPPVAAVVAAEGIVHVEPHCRRKSLVALKTERREESVSLVVLLNTYIIKRISYNISKSLPLTCVMVLMANSKSSSSR